MNQAAIIFEGFTLYWYSVILALAAAAGGCFFLACCSRREIPPWKVWCMLLTALLLSALFSRLIFWYCRPYSFSSLNQALTVPATENHGLAGVFLGCFLALLIFAGSFPRLPLLLDCGSVALCGAISLGRLGNFFTDLDRGQIVTELTHLPWAWPALNTTSGELEYRLAVFLLQSMVTGILFIVLAALFFSRRVERAVRDGGLTILFLMVYGASQIILDSTRYDSLYLRSNGFVSLVQILAAAALLTSLTLSSVQAVRMRGFRRWMIPVWTEILVLFGCTGYMEYYVQRHGRLALFSYGIMGQCLLGILTLGSLLWVCAWKRTNTDAIG